MNIFKRIYCRAFQKIMYIAIPFLPYRDPEILKDNSDIIEELKLNKITKILLMVSRTVKKQGLTAELEKLFNENNIEYTIFDEVLPNPTTSNVLRVKEIYLENNCQGIIAFGGGSVIDCAKAALACVVRSKKPIKKMAGVIKVRKKIPLLIAIPTTAGSGSEATVATVITDEETHHKFVISDFCLIPHYAVLDAKNIISLPKHITATTGMDALTHAVEAYIGKARTRKSKKDAVEAVKLIIENLEKAYADGNDVAARNNMLLASYLAGKAFTVSYVGYVHAIAHTLGGKYGVSHGLANAILLPIILREYGKKASKKLGELAKLIGLADNNLSNDEASEIFISKIEDMNKSMNIPNKFDCILKDDIPFMAKLANKEANPLYPVPVLFDERKLMEIYLKLSN